MRVNTGYVVNAEDVHVCWCGMAGGKTLHAQALTVLQVVAVSPKVSRTVNCPQAPGTPDSTCTNTKV